MVLNVEWLPDMMIDLYQTLKSKSTREQNKSST